MRDIDLLGRGGKVEPEGPGLRSDRLGYISANGIFLHSMVLLDRSIVEKAENH
jgi:hypothetical protein